MSSGLKKALLVVGVIIGVAWAFSLLVNFTNSYIRNVVNEVKPTQQAQVQPVVMAPVAETPVAAAPITNKSVISNTVVASPWYFNSGEKGSAVLPFPAVCHGDQVDLDGKIYGDGVGGSPPVMVDFLIPAGTKVSLIWGSCSTEAPEQVWARLTVRPEGFIKVLP